MKVFLSWSGDLSHKVACVFREWLPSVIQAVTPYVSSEDIDKGTRWSTDIAAELAESSYGIIFVTKENLIAPWIHFEAGALSKSIDKSNVTPFLFGVKRSEVQGPLLQFQSVLFERAEVHKLLISLNQRLKEVERLKEDSLKKALDVWWPQLESALKGLDVAPTPGVRRSGNQPPDIMEELLELVRSQQRILSSPEELLPPAYLHHIMERRLRGRQSEREGQILARLHSDIVDLEELVSKLLEKVPSPEAQQVKMAVGKLHEYFHRLESRDRDRETFWTARRSSAKADMLEEQKKLSS